MMDLDINLETGPPSSSTRIIRDGKGRWRDVLGRFAKRNTVSVHTNTDVVQVPEFVQVQAPDTEPEFASNFPVHVETATVNHSKYLGTVKQVFSFVVMAIGLMGGMYAFLRLIGSELVEDKFEIIILRI